MSTINALLLVCDDCGNDMRFTSTGVRMARHRAKRDGWCTIFINANMRDRCPACVERYGGLKSHKVHKGTPWGHALREVLDDGRQIKATARKWGLPYRTLCKRVRETREARNAECG
jgi:hypothetical protein